MLARYIRKISSSNSKPTPTFLLPPQNLNLGKTKTTKTITTIMP